MLCYNIHNNSSIGFIFAWRGQPSDWIGQAGRGQYSVAGGSGKTKEAH